MVNRTERKNQAAVDAIVTAAEELLAEGGVAAVSLEAISQRADVAIQTIYNRVGGRPAVLTAVAERAFEANRNYLDAAHASGKPPADRIRDVVAAYVRFAAEKPNQYKLLAHPPTDAPAPDRVHELVQEQNGKLAALIREGIDAGLARADLDPETIATALWGMWDGILSLTFRPDDARPTPDEMTKILATAESIIEFGLSPR